MSAPRITLDQWRALLAVVDEGSYANASLLGRITTIVAGPLANYLFASVLFFGSIMIGGQPVPTTKVSVQPNSAAETGQMKTGDKVVEVGGKPVTEWDQMRGLIAASPGKPVDIGVERDGQVVHLTVTPASVANGEGRIGVESIHTTRPGSAERVRMVPEIGAITFRSFKSASRRRNSA